MKKNILISSLIFSAFLSIPGYAAEFIPQDPSSAAGYYSSEEAELLFLPNGTAYSITSFNSGALQGPFDYSVLSDGSSLIIIDETNEEAACFVRQEEKDRTESGGIYYAFYGDCIGIAGETDYQEGKQVQFGEYIFDNDYSVYIRDSLSVFFGIDEAVSGSSVSRMEGAGFASPEDAAAAYLKGLQNNDIFEMMSAFAVETYVEHYSLANVINYYTAYLPSLAYLPAVSDLSLQLNIENRRAEIMDIIQAHYLVLTGSKTLLGDSAQLPIPLTDNYTSSDEMVQDLFASEDSSYLTDIRFENEFIDPAKLAENYASEAGQRSLLRQASTYNADEVRSVAAKFYVGNETHFLLIDAARYGDVWYLFNSPGALSSLLGTPTSLRGMLPVSYAEANEIQIPVN